MRPCYLLALVAWLLVAPLPALAQYAEVPRPLPAGAISFFGFTLAEQIRAATQVGRRLFIGERFTQLASAAGGWFVIGSFTSVKRTPHRRLCARGRRPHG